MPWLILFENIDASGTLISHEHHGRQYYCDGCRGVTTKKLYSKVRKWHNRGKNTTLSAGNF